MSEPIHIHCDQPGVTFGEAVFELCPNHGKPCWKGTLKIETIFGSGVEGEVSAYGSTKEIVMERLADETKKLYDSLWA